MKIKYKQYDDKKAKPSGFAHSRVSNYSGSGSRKTCLIWTLLGLVFVWIIYSRFWASSEPPSPDENLCYGYNIKERVCQKLEQNEITGNMCLELCLLAEMDLPTCADEPSFKSADYFTNKFRYFQMPDSESTLIYVENYEMDGNRLTETLTFDEFKEKISKFIMERVNDPTTTEKIVDRIIFTTDANKDNKLNYQEANTLWTLLNNRATFYMLVLGERPYIPRIKNICGGLLELEEIKHHLKQPKEFSLLKSVFSRSIYWYKLDPLYRLKIALGILEFFSEASDFNPNDEFGLNSLVLCQPIEETFGFTFFNEAKLINFDWLLTVHEATQQLSRNTTSCQTDLDCVLNGQCKFKCDQSSNRCTEKLVRPQLVTYCEFLRKFLQDSKNISTELEPLLDKCSQLKAFYADDRVIYGESEMPLSYSKVSEFVERREYWSRAEEYSLLLHNLKSFMWEKVRLAVDPKRPKKNTKAKKSDDETTPK